MVVVLTSLYSFLKLAINRLIISLSLVYEPVAGSSHLTASRPAGFYFGISCLRWTDFSTPEELQLSLVMQPLLTWRTDGRLSV
jgi:hypothetical protein